MFEQKEIESLSEVFQALSDPTRLRILELLKNTNNPLCVNAIAHHVGISQSAASQHLKILRQHGFVSVKKEGYFKHYSLTLDNLESVRSMRMTVLGENFNI
jgi:DNA-binding transcriptional ArsR family regulator